MTPQHTRRTVLKAAGTALAVTGALSRATGAVATSSVSLEKYVRPLPIPEVREPDGTGEGPDFYDIPVREFSKRLHPDLPETTL